ncbi:DnaD domain protein [Clostridiales bacterium 1_7_47FAA]|uniref:DnaD domain protein n=1 Tax=Enterocloster hominis (ex Hitch et al. 2024) TaxID=1917870 RepID=A0ABV1D8E7_9FIRM|nr:DnaD domain protein [Clostridiales bacterium 1_7_47FAA]
MGVNFKDRWSVPSTAVAHEFIDEYMARANGEYVKVYLFVLRHQGEDITIEGIADALDHTESDVRRALAYWEKLGILSGTRKEAPASCASMGRQDEGAVPSRGVSARTQAVRNQAAGLPEVHQPPAHDQVLGNYEVNGAMAGDIRVQAAGIQDIHGQGTGIQDTHGQGTGIQDTHGQGTGIQDTYGQGTGIQDTHGQAPGIWDAHGQGDMAQGRREQNQVVQENRDKPVYSAEQVNRLSQDEGFSQLLYIAQKYLNKVFTPRDCQVFAYLYEDLGMNEELLEYLVEYCVQNGHTSIRYIEAVARSWHEKGIHTAQEAKDYSASYNRDSFAVMKAFGINSRKPAAPEQKLMDKWFKDYGFNRDVVLEACNRTITAIHNPSFQYADKILTDWKEAGVRGIGDIRELDARRTAAREDTSRSRDKRLQTYDTAVSGQGKRTRKGAPNQFHNFEQRDTDYDALMLKQVKEWVGQQP